MGSSGALRGGAPLEGVGRDDGSAAGEGFDPEESDLDFVVRFEPRDPPELFDRHFGLKEDFEDLFGREVDLVTEGALDKDPSFAEGIQRTGCRCMHPERTPRMLRQIADACSFVLSVTTPVSPPGACASTSGSSLFATC